MSLPIHLFIHFFFAFVAGGISWFFFGNPVLSFISGFLGGVLIDLDHLIDYFLAFGSRWNLSYFIRGYQFLKSDKVYVLFHGWEYVILLAIVVWAVGAQSSLGVALFALGLGGLFHLIADTLINHGMSFRAYSILYRLVNKFEVEKIVTPEHYLEHMREKQSTRFE
ncbi:MAG: hypothetical protein Q7S04_03620 [Candidatus Moranbacteria bacterium]|nr:hypothetical protein [Candidatus Moranbacteria bacterium]